MEINFNNNDMRELQGQKLKADNKLQMRNSERFLLT